MKLQLSENQLQTQIKYFAYYEMASGMLTAIFTVLLLAQVENLSGLALLVYLSLLILSGFTFYCGRLTLKQPAKGLLLSRISLLTQFLGFAAGGYAFRYFAGPFVALSIDLTKSVTFKADVSFGEISFLFNGSSDALLLSVNVVAMLLFWRTTLWLNEWTYRYNNALPSVVASPDFGENISKSKLSLTGLRRDVL